MAKTNKRKSNSYKKRKTNRVYKKKDYNSNDGMLTSSMGTKCVALYSYDEF